MSEPFVGQIIRFAGTFAPAGWAICDGGLLPIAEYQQLFSAIGTTYGGDGERTFALPDLRGRVPIGFGQGQGLQNYPIGQQVGQEAVTLTPAEMPHHSHPAVASEQLGTSSVPAGNVILGKLGGQAQSQYGLGAYGPATSEVQLGPASVSSSGGGQPHENRQPFQTINYCIALTGGGALPFIGQIVLLAFNFAPRDFAICDGQLLPISHYTALYSLLGASYGGDSRVNFALPNLGGCAALGAGQGPGLSNYALGEQGGAAAVTLATNAMPRHSHGFAASTAQATTPDPKGNLLARAWRALEKSDAIAAYLSPAANEARTALASGAIGAAGGGQPHDNMQPYLVLNFAIALNGTYPTRS